MRLDRIGQLAEKGPGHPSDQWRDPDVEAPVLLRMNAHVVERLSGHRWSRAVDQPPAQVLRLEHLTEALDTPVVDQELQPGPRPQPPVPVVAEDPDDAGPDVRDLFQWDPGTEPLGQLGGGEVAAGREKYGVALAAGAGGGAAAGGPVGPGAGARPPRGAPAPDA